MPNVPTSAARQHGRVPFRWILPTSQFFFCILLLWPVRDLLIDQVKRSLEPEVKLSLQDLTLEPEHEGSPDQKIPIDPEQQQAIQKRRRAIEAMETRQWIVMALNAPSGLVQLPYAILSPSKQEWIPIRIDFRSWRTITWPLLGVPFWWSVGRGIEALLSAKRKVIDPHITWLESITNSALCLLCSFVAVGFPLSGELDREPASILLISAFALWAALAGAVVAGRFAQWRIRRNFRQSAPAGSEPA